MNQGLQKKSKLWSKAGREQLRQLELEPWAGRRRDELLEMLEQMGKRIEPLDQAVEQAAAAQPRASRLQTHPGVGPVIAFGHGADHGRGKPLPQFAELGQLSGTESGGELQRADAVDRCDQQTRKPFLRHLLVEGASSAVRGDKDLGRVYARLKARKHHGVAKVAVARKLAVRLYWMERTEKSYPEVVRNAGEPESSRGQQPGPSV